MIRLWKKQKKRRSGGESIPVSAPGNSYYESVSDRFGIAQVILFLALLAFVALAFLTNTRLITYQNLYYFIKDLNASAGAVDVLHTDAVSYPAAESQSFTLYRKGLAVAGNGSVTVFTANGRQTISKTQQYQNPVAVGSGKYLLVYELGGTQYSLYNSYTRIYTGKTATVIRGAAISPSGMYALISESGQSVSTVELFNSRFEQIARYPYRSYVTDVAINEKGTCFAVLLSGAENGSFVTSVRFYEPGKAEIASEQKVGNGLGLRCSFTGSSTLAVLCSNGIHCFSTRGKLIAECPFEGKNMVCADIGEEGCAVVLKNPGISPEFHAIVFDKNGKMLYNEIVEGSPEAVALCKNAVFLKHSEGLTRINLTDGIRTEVICDTDHRVMLAVDEGRVLLCSSKKAVTIRFAS